MMGTPEGAMRSSEGEQGAAPQLVVVRSLLRSLPQCCCPPGFEYRFHHRLMGEIRGVRPVRFERNWAMGWAGVGLGFAAALAVAVVAFDVNPRAPMQPQMAASPAMTVPSGNVAAAEAPLAQPVSVEEGVQSQLAADEGTQAKAPAKDSLRAKSPTSLQEYPSQMVGSGNP